MGWANPYQTKRQSPAVPSSEAALPHEEAGLWAQAAPKKKDENKDENKLHARKESGICRRPSGIEAGVILSRRLPNPTARKMTNEPSQDK